MREIQAAIADIPDYDMDVSDHTPRRQELKPSILNPIVLDSQNPAYDRRCRAM